MNTTRDTPSGACRQLRKGQRVRALYRGGRVEGTVLELRQTADRIRVVVDVDDETELDTDASRVEVLRPRCPRCQSEILRRQVYRCSDCGADLVTSTEEKAINVRSGLQ
jgi:DNA-directed RNA polymerase subunit RPC12/RpoP